MENLEWNEIEKFHSHAEYAKFVEWLSNKINEGCAEDVPVGDRYAGEYFEERWIAHKKTGSIWRLVKPQAPFCGYFGRVG